MIIDYNIYYGEPIIHLWYRKGIKKIHEIYNDFEPYFYVDALNEDKTDFEGVKRVEKGFKNLYGQDVIKVICKTPKYVGELKKNFGITYEADILFEKRFLIDKGAKYGDKPKIMYLDIEVLHEKGIFPEPNEAKYSIGSISFTSNYNNKYISLFLYPEINLKKEKKIWKNRLTGKEEEWLIYYYKDEKQLLKDFIYFVNKGDPDIFTGWNTDFFDLPYIINRMKNIGIDYNLLSILKYVYIPKPRFNLQYKKIEQEIPVIKGRNIFDLLIPYKKMNISELKSNTLGNVANHELGIKKIEFPGDIIDLYKNNKEKFIEYNVGDVELTKLIDKKVGIVRYFFKLSKFIGCKLGDTMSNSKMGDIFTLKYCKKKGLVLPTKNPTSPETFEGAIVKEPIVGLHDNILVLDLSKIYPSIIISCNLSPETVSEKGDIIIGNGMRFCSNPIGFSPEVLKLLFALREEKKIKKDKLHIDSLEWEKAKNEEQFVKDLINSYYGLLSYAGYRLYSPNIGSTITYMGRKIIEHCIKIIENIGYEIVYGDTDSIFVKGKEKDLKNDGYMIEKKINDSFFDFSKCFGIKEHCFSIKFEKIYKKIIFLKKKSLDAGAKKKYVGILYYQNGQDLEKIEYKGIESKRSDSSEITQKIMLDVFSLILKSIDKEKVDLYIEEQIKNFKALDIEKIAIPKGINQNIKEYEGLNKNNNKKSMPANIRGVNYVNNVFKTTIGKGSKPRYLYVKKISGGKYPNTNVICFEYKEQINDDFWKEFNIDYDIMLKKLILDKIENIYEALNWSFRGKGIQTKIEKWKN